MENSNEDISFNFTVVIPAYNGAKRLPKVLSRLLEQTGIEQCKWEIIVVDNNSSDHTAELIKSYQKNWIGNSSLRYCLETQQGIAFARQKGVNEARGQLIGFLDDDMIPAPDWVAQAIAFGKEYPQAGAYGGQIHGDFEEDPPKDFARIQSFLAIRERGTQPKLYEPEILVLPPGAALVVRKPVWKAHVPEKLALLGRLGKSMLSGDDYEVLIHIHKANWEIWYNPQMHSYHQIPKSRLEKDYLIKLARGCGLCIFQLRLINLQNWQKPILMVRVFLGNLRRLLKHIFKYKYELKNNIIAIVEMEFYFSSMISPLYSLKLTINKLINHTFLKVHDSSQ